MILCQYVKPWASECRVNVTFWGPVSLLSTDAACRGFVQAPGAIVRNLRSCVERSLQCQRIRLTRQLASWAERNCSSHTAEREPHPPLQALSSHTLVCDVCVCDVGPMFPFMNRINECKEHLRALGALDDLRGVGEWGLHKRRVLVPADLGMPGTRKSRFALDSVRHLVEVVGSVKAVVESVWPLDADKERKPELVAQLLSAARYRNLRLTLSGPVLNVERVVALELDANWLCQLPGVTVHIPWQILLHSNRFMMAS